MKLADKRDSQTRYHQLLTGVAEPPRPGQMSERDLQAVIEHMCLLLRLRYYHTRNSRGSVPGFPDLVICATAAKDKYGGVIRRSAPGKGVIYRELKTDKGRCTMAQEEWLRDLAAAGGDADVWRPADVASGRIWQELKALTHGGSR